MLFITITLVLLVCGYLYEKETIEDGEDFVQFLLYYGCGAAFIALFVCGLAFGASVLYVHLTDAAPAPSWVFIPFDIED